MRPAAGLRTLAAAVVLAGTAGCHTPPPPPEPLPEDMRTTLIGLDGADWRNALPLARQGKVPVLNALRQAGTSGLMRSNPSFEYSPVLWTTIATGKYPQKHGVTHFMAKWGGIQRDIPTPSLARKCRALWNLFTEAQVPSGFVGWWVTWPAEPVLGFIVSDHFSVSRFDLGDRYEDDVTDVEFHRYQTYPDGLAKDLRHLKVPRQSVTRDDLALFADLEEGYRMPEGFGTFRKESEFAIAHSVDRTHHAVAKKLLAEEAPPLFGVYYEGIDIMQHFLWEFMDPDGTGTKPPADLRRRWGPVIERYYSWIDDRVAELVATGEDGRAVMLVSDHGFRPSRERYEKMGITGEHRRESFFLYAGPGIARGRIETEMDAVDVTPMILAYHGLPFAEDMDGRPEADVFTREFRTAHPLKIVPTYETGPIDRNPIPETSVTRDLEERIRSMGYID